MVWRGWLLFILGMVLNAKDPVTALIPSGLEGLRMQIWHQPPKHRRTNPYPVLILHGATFPTRCAAAWRIDGRSWMDDLASNGFDTWALDFVGYGGSDRFPAMQAPASGQGPLGRTEEMALQVGRAVAWITLRQGAEKVVLVAHSAGSFAAGRFASEHPELVERLVLFGAPGPVPPVPSEALETKEAHRQMSVENQWDSWELVVKSGPRPQITRKAFDRWVGAYLATDSESAQRQPPSVRIPMGMLADFARQQAGVLPYVPEQIRVPTLLIRGALDEVVGEAETKALFQRLAASPLRRSVTVPQGGHRVHLEAGRVPFFREVRTFLGVGRK